MSSVEIYLQQNKMSRILEINCSGRPRGIMSPDDTTYSCSVDVGQSEEQCAQLGHVRKEDILELFRTRPAHIVDKRGHSGEEISCLSNFIPVVTTPEWVLYQYHVSFAPSIDSKAVRTALVHEHEEMFGKEVIFDGLILYIPFRLPEKETRLTSTNPFSGGEVKLTVKLTNELPPGNPQCVTLFNLCNRKIEIWPGYISAIRYQEEELLMCCEMSYKVLRVDTVLDFMRELHNRHKDGRFLETCTQILVGTSVLTRYNNRTYRIDDILWHKDPSEEIRTPDGRLITLADYYATQYNKKIKDFEQPLLLSRAKKRGDIPPGEKSDRDVYLIPELCAMTGLSEEMRSSRRVMQDLAQYTRVPPKNRIQYARQYLGSLEESKEVVELFSKWSLSLGDDVKRISARVLPAEELKGGDERRFCYSPESGDWARELRGTKVTEGIALNSWVFVFPANDRQKARDFFNTIRDIGRKIGMQIGDPETVQLSRDSATEYLEAIKYGRGKQLKTQMVVAMVPNDNKTRYDAIKKLCCLEDPVPNQVIRSASLDKNVISVCTKVILQMNCKLGGSLWKVRVPMKAAMVIGYDVYQDSTNRGKTVGAAVFSMNPGMTRWYSQCALHEGSKDQICNLAQFCENGLKKYHEHNGFFPDKIFLFRDGCGDGQIPVVFQQEVPQVQLAVQNVGRSMDEAYKPKLSFIIVTKKVNARFFQEQGGQLTNPPPGTVVDSVITRRERYDFYLVPQSVRQGTVTPVSYNVILDESGLSPDQMQRLAYKLCHLYYNWQGTIRVPAPCQYAHKLAFLVSQSLHKPVKEFLADKLYFL